jgi:hypothetical protein
MSARSSNIRIDVRVLAFISVGTPLRGLWSHQKGGFYHDGRFQSLEEVLARYDQHLKLRLNPQEKKDLVEFLKSL